MSETMVELTVIFDNPAVENYVLLTGPYEYPEDQYTGAWVGINDLREQAEEKLGPLKDEQCFYRFLTR